MKSLPYIAAAYGSKTSGVKDCCGMGKDGGKLVSITVEVCRNPEETVPVLGWFWLLPGSMEFMTS